MDIVKWWALQELQSGYSFVSVVQTMYSGHQCRVWSPTQTTRLPTPYRTWPALDRLYVADHGNSRVRSMLIPARQCKTAHAQHVLVRLSRGPAPRLLRAGPVRLRVRRCEAELRTLLFQFPWSQVSVNYTMSCVLFGPYLSHSLVPGLELELNISGLNTRYCTPASTSFAPSSQLFNCSTLKSDVTFNRNRAWWGS